MKKIIKLNLSVTELQSILFKILAKKAKINLNKYEVSGFSLTSSNYEIIFKLKSRPILAKPILTM